MCGSSSIWYINIFKSVNMTISVRSLFHQTYFMIMKGRKTFNLILTAAGYFCMYFSWNSAWKKQQYILKRRIKNIHYFFLFCLNFDPHAKVMKRLCYWALKCEVWPDCLDLRLKTWRLNSTEAWSGHGRTYYLLRYFFLW